MSFYDFEVEQKFRAEAAEIIARYPQGHERSAMIPLLHLVQSIDGYVTANGIGLIADILNCQRAEVSAVATFYTQFKRHPNGEYTVGVCTNALCAVLGGDNIMETLEKELEVGNDETTADGKITLEALECNAGCDYAPVVMVNWEFFDNQTPESAVQLVRDIKAGKPVHPTRGSEAAPTFKEASRILAGFPNPETANQGVAAGPASLWGLKVAEEQGMQAPDPGQFAEPEAAQAGDTSSGGAANEAGKDPVGKEHSSADHKEADK